MAVIVIIMIIIIIVIITISIIFRFSKDYINIRTQSVNKRECCYK